MCNSSQKPKCFVHFDPSCDHVCSLSSAKVYIDKKLKRGETGAADDLIGDIFRQSRLSKKELYATITELQIGGVETVRPAKYSFSHNRFK